MLNRKFQHFLVILFFVYHGKQLVNCKIDLLNYQLDDIYNAKRFL